MNILIGGVLSLLSVLLIPLFFVFGYYVRVLESTAANEEQPPAFDDWGDLGKNGLLAFVLTIAYYIVPVLVFAVLGGLGAVTGNGNAATASLVTGGLISFVLFVALTYVYPAALTNFARTGKVGSAFAFGELRGVVLSGDYLGAWVLGFVVFAAGFLVVGLLSIIPIIGTLIGLFVNFYIQVVAYRMFGVAYRRAHSESGRSAPDAVTA